MSTRKLWSVILSSYSWIVREYVLYVESFRSKFCFLFDWQMLLIYLRFCRWWLININMSAFNDFLMRETLSAMLLICRIICFSILLLFLIFSRYLCVVESSDKKEDTNYDEVKLINNDFSNKVYEICIALRIE